MEYTNLLGRGCWNNEMPEELKYKNGNGIGIVYYDVLLLTRPRWEFTYELDIEI